MAIDLRRLVAAGGVIAAIAAFVAPFEGLRTKAYPDPANKKIATICYGETNGVRFGETKTAEECREMLEKRIPGYLVPIDKALPGLPDNRRIAYADAAYNMGVSIITRRTNGVAGTSIADLERAGRWQDACRRLLVFDMAGRQRLPGLTARRKAEAALCLEVWNAD